MYCHVLMNHRQLTVYYAIMQPENGSMFWRSCSFHPTRVLIVLMLREHTEVTSSRKEEEMI